LANFEYTIFCIFNGGKPFSLRSYNSLESAKFDLYNMVSLEKERNRPYYVHNDFYENEYPSSISGKFFCIKKRQVTEWEIYSEQKENKCALNNIYYFNNFV